MMIDLSSFLSAVLEQRQSQRSSICTVLLLHSGSWCLEVSCPGSLSLSYPI